jgi:hypothetical protein
MATPYFSLPLRKRLELLGRTPLLMSQWGMSQWGRRHSFVVSLLAKRLSQAHADDLSGDPGAIQRHRKKLPLQDKVKEENRGGGRKSRKKKSSRKVKRHASKTKRYRKFR